MTPIETPVTKAKPSVPREFRYDINALRALAVVAVIAYHFGSSTISGGFVGVDVFFVISGFLITSQIHAALQLGNFSFKSFYVSRLRRIFPALAVVCAATLAWGWFYTLPYDYRSFSRHALAALFFVSNIAFSGEQGYFDIAAYGKPLLHTWSLSVEGQFYLFLPLFLVITWRFCGKRITWGLAAAFVLSLLWCIFVATPVEAFYLLPARAWEFLAGGLLACSPRMRFSKIWANCVALLGVAALVGSCIFLNAALLWPSLWTLIPVLGVIALLMVPDATVVAPVIKVWPLQRLGDLSYSLYLWTWPVLVYARQYSSSIDQTLTPERLAVLLVIVLLLAVLSWRYVEQPIRRHQIWRSNQRIISGVVFVSVAVLAFTFAVVATQGLRQRFPAYVQRVFSPGAVDTPRGECFRDGSSKKTAAEQFCIFSNDKTTRAPTVLLWGDSHANQYLSALTGATQINGSAGAIATQSDCRPNLPGAPTDLKPESRAACDRFNSEVNEFLAHTTSIKTIVLGRLWSDEEGLAATVTLTKSLVSSGKKIVLIGPLPSPGFHVPERWSKMQLIAGRGIDDVTVPLASQKGALQALLLLKAQLASEIESGNIVLIDPFQTLCDDRQCYLVQNGLSNFGDISHLSQKGSLLFVPAFLSALEKLQR